jgi:hypothetical protein
MSPPRCAPLEAEPATPPEKDGESNGPAEEDGQADTPAEEDGDTDTPAEEDGETDTPAEEDGDTDTPAEEDGVTNGPAEEDGETDSPDGRSPAGGGVTEGVERRPAAAELTTAVPRTARRGPISRAARLNTLRVAVSYPSRYASSRSGPVRYHWCRRPAAYPVQAVNAASSVIRRASFPGAVIVRFSPCA